MPQFPPEVEKWRGLVARYFPPQEIDRALWVIWHESGGNPGIPSRFNAGGGENSWGLFQLNLNAHPSMANSATDPEAATAYAAKLFADQGWRPWSVTHQGFPADLTGSAAGGAVGSGFSSAMGPAGRRFGEITGTDYKSAEEREFYLAQQGKQVPTASASAASSPQATATATATGATTMPQYDEATMRILNAIAQSVTGRPDATWDSLTGDDLSIAARMAQQRGIDLTPKPPAQQSEQQRTAYNPQSGQMEYQAKDASGNWVFTGTIASRPPSAEEPRKLTDAGKIFDDVNAIGAAGRAAAAPAAGAPPAAAGAPAPGMGTGVGAALGAAGAPPAQAEPQYANTAARLGLDPSLDLKANSFEARPEGGGQAGANIDAYWLAQQADLAKKGFDVFSQGPRDLSYELAPYGIKPSGDYARDVATLLKVTAKRGELSMANPGAGGSATADYMRAGITNTKGLDSTPSLPLYGSKEQPTGSYVYGDLGSIYEGMVFDPETGARVMGQGGSMNISEPSVIKGLLSGDTHGVLGVSPEKVTVDPLGTEAEQGKAAHIEKIVAALLGGGEPMAWGANWWTGGVPEASATPAEVAPAPVSSGRSRPGATDSFPQYGPLPPEPAHVRPTGAGASALGGKGTQLTGRYVNVAGQNIYHQMANGQWMGPQGVMPWGFEPPVAPADPWAGLRTDLKRMDADMMAFRRGLAGNRDAAIGKDFYSDILGQQWRRGPDGMWYQQTEYVSDGRDARQRRSGETVTAGDGSGRGLIPNIYAKGGDFLAGLMPKMGEPRMGIPGGPEGGFPGDGESFMPEIGTDLGQWLSSRRQSQPAPENDRASLVRSLLNSSGYGSEQPRPMRPFSNPQVLEALARGVNKRARLMLPSGMI